ncbi:MAG: hypothetical protein AAB405_02255 [Patescibacteria group bacterium]
MKFFKVVATILIFSGGIAGTYLIIKNSDSEISNIDLSSLKQSIKDSVSDNPLVWLDNISATSSLNEAIFNESQEKYNANSLQSFNLTKIASQSIFSKAQEASQNGNDSVALLTQNDLEIQVAIQETLDSFTDPLSIFYDPVSENNLAIIDDNSLQAQIKYYEDYQEIIKRAFDNFKKDSGEILRDVFEKKDFSSAQKAMEIYKTLADNFIKLIVPSSLVEFHIKNIQHYQNAYLIYRAISQYSQDPLKTYLAVKAIPQLYGETEEIQNLFKEILEERTKEFNL